MATATAPPGGIPRVVDFKTPKRLERVPVWASTTIFLVVLMAISAFIRTRYIGGSVGQFWKDEAITTGIASHSLSAIPGILRHDGSPPLFYLLLHVWIEWFGPGEAADPLAVAAVRAAHASRPACGRAGACSAGAPGMYAAVLFAFNTFLTAYAQETRMYALMALLGMLATAAFIHGFVYRRRRYVIVFAVCAGADALHARVGHLLRRRLGCRADSDLAGERRSPRHRARRGARLRRRRRPVPAVAAQLHLPGDPHGRAVGRRPSASACRSCSRATCSAATASRWRCSSRCDRSGWRRCSPRRGRRTRDGTADVVADLADRRDADARLARLADHARVRSPLLRPDPRVDPAAGRAGARARSGVVGLVAHRAVRCSSWFNPSSYAPQLQERYARHRRRDDAAATPGRPGGRRAAGLRRRWPGTTCPAGCSTPPRSARGQGPQLHELGLRAKASAGTPTRGDPRSAGC